jgi:hypothetical protein
MNICSKLTALAGMALCPALLLSQSCRAAEPAPAAVSHDLGVWQKHEYSFVFMGFTSTYSCDGLADKIKVLLIAAGARRDSKSQPGACASGFGRPDKFARATLTFYTLAPAGADAPAGVKPVDAVWRPVALSPRTPRELNIGDCELVEQFRHNVLPMFTTRNIEDHVTCVPHQNSGSNIDLRFESLAPTPAAPGSAPVQPGGT